LQWIWLFNARLIILGQKTTPNGLKYVQMVRFSTPKIHLKNTKIFIPSISRLKLGKVFGEELKRIIFVWAEWGVRIIRVDNPHTKAFSFWEWVIAETKQKYPDMIFLAEAFTRPKVMQQLAKGGYTQSYTYYTWRTTKQELIEYMTELTQSEMKYYFRPNFWPNTHDINPPLLQSGHEPNFLIRYFMAATLSSNYGIFGPTFEYMVHEVFPGKEEYWNSEKYEIKHWDWETYK
jgi:starch synthase (maltosyl-transferring)